MCFHQTPFKKQFSRRAAEVLFNTPLRGTQRTATTKTSPERLILLSFFKISNSYFSSIGFKSFSAPLRLCAKKDVFMLITIFISTAFSAIPIPEQGQR
jgi:hypothetical protein